MKSNIYIAANNIISPLGFTSSENFGKLKNMQSGIQYLRESKLSNEPIYAAIIDNEKLDSEFNLIKTETEYTRLEKLFLLSINEALSQNPDIDITSPKTLIVLSSTKGNIDLLETKNIGKFDKERVYLWSTGKIIAKHFKNPNQPVIVSNACISGVLAIILGKRLLLNSAYDTVIVTGGDILTHFVVSGFQSLKAVGSQICKPYDALRDGISLGEACGTIILTNNKFSVKNEQNIIVKGGASSNDANHISGPSRTGDGLFLSIKKALTESEIEPAEINYISGHGTATLFNDEMESLAITDAQLNKVPMNSLKSYFGHTLGAAGIVESIVGLHSMKENILIGTYNYNEMGVSKPINIIKKTQSSTVNTCLKIAAGFGGCNAAVIFQKQ